MSQTRSRHYIASVFQAGSTGDVFETIRAALTSVILAFRQRRDGKPRSFQGEILSGFKGKPLFFQRKPFQFYKESAVAGTTLLSKRQDYDQ